MHFDKEFFIDFLRNSIYWMIGNLTYSIIPLGGIAFYLKDKWIDVIGDGFFIFLACALLTSIGIDVLMAKETISNSVAAFINLGSLLMVLFCTTVYIKLAEKKINFNAIVDYQIYLVLFILFICVGIKTLLIY